MTRRWLQDADVGDGLQSNESDTKNELRTPTSTFVTNNLGGQTAPVLRRQQDGDWSFTSAIDTRGSYGQLNMKLPKSKFFRYHFIVPSMQSNVNESDPPGEAFKHDLNIQEELTNNELDMDVIPNPAHHQLLLLNNRTSETMPIPLKILTDNSTEKEKILANVRAKQFSEKWQEIVKSRRAERARTSCLTQKEFRYTNKRRQRRNSNISSISLQRIRNTENCRTPSSDSFSDSSISKQENHKVRINLKNQRPVQTMVLKSRYIPEGDYTSKEVRLKTQFLQKICSQG